MSSENQFCVRCGAQIPSGASFCARCGTPVSGGAAPQAPPPYYSSREYRREQRRHEKQEKQEKQEKGEKHEKGGPGTGRIAPIVGGLILVWLGVTFYLQQIGSIPSNNWWAYFAAGIGAILILQGVLLYAISHRPFYGPFIGGAILLLIGVGIIANYSFDLFWPIVIIVIGAAIIVSSFMARRKTPTPPAP